MYRLRTHVSALVKVDSKFTWPSNIQLSIITNPVSPTQSPAKLGGPLFMLVEDNPFKQILSGNHFPQASIKTAGQHKPNKHNRATCPFLLLPHHVALMSVAPAVLAASYSSCALGSSESGLWCGHCGPRLPLPHVVPMSAASGLAATTRGVGLLGNCFRHPSP